MSSTRLVVSAVTVASLAATASAAPRKKPPAPPATLPAVGEAVTVTGAATWPTREWMYDAPSAQDAAGKIIVHWFCGPKIPTCVEDLARIVTLKEAGRVYVVAHVDGPKRQAKKLDPIRESEGVGSGTVAFGRAVTTMMKQMAITSPTSVVVGLDGKVALVSSGVTPVELDVRDKKVAELVAGIQEYVASNASPSGVKPGDRFTLSMSIKLASWLGYSTKAPMAFTVTVPPDIKCDATKLERDKLKIDGQTLTAAVSCTAPRGSYEARGTLRFGYDTPGGGAGLGAEDARWTFAVTP